MSDRKTVYGLVRADIPAVNQGVQLAHAAIGSGQHYGGYDCTLVVLVVPNEATLIAECDALERAGVENFLFHETEYPKGKNAACTRPVDQLERELLSHLPLWRLDNE